MRCWLRTVILALVLISAVPVWGQGSAASDHSWWRWIFDNPVQSAATAKAVKDAPDGYLRVVRDARKRPKILQTGIGHFVLGGGQHVDLVAAVHMAEGSYYAALNQRFKHYNAVLYELIVDTGGGTAPRGGLVVSQDEDNASTLSRVQLKLCRMLGFRFQLYSINYAAANFRHADLTYDEFQKAMAVHGESVPGLLMRVLQMAFSNVSTMQEDPEINDLDILPLLYRDPTPAEQRTLRRILACAFPSVERMLSDVGGTSVIADRDRRAIAVLKRELALGRQNLAIFYGAGHMTDLERRLLRLPGAHRTSIEWLDAWKLDADEKP